MVEAFKSTLDEVCESDLIIHVIDISHPEFFDQIQTVEKTLTELKVFDKPIIMVFNKIDSYKYVEKDQYDLTPKTNENLSLEDLKKMWIVKNKKSVFISAKKGINIDELRQILYKEVKLIHSQRFPYDDYFYSDEFTE